jgi:hypothetical protein
MSSLNGNKKRKIFLTIVAIFLFVCASGCKNNLSVFNARSGASVSNSHNTGKIGGGVTLDQGDLQYLIFKQTNVPYDQIDSNAQEIADMYGPNDPNQKRLWGIGIWGVNPLRQSPQEMQALVNKAFDLAERLKAPVHFDIFFGQESFFTAYGQGSPVQWWNDPEMCEWSKLPGPGESPRCVPEWFNWGTWMQSPGLPALQSPKFRSFLIKQIREGFIAPFTIRYQGLKEKNLEYLFAGVALGGETGYFNHVDPNIPPSDRGIHGYASLHWAANLNPALLGGKEPSLLASNAREMMWFLNVTIVADFLRYITRFMMDETGLPRYKLYTHTVPGEAMIPKADFMTWPIVKSAVAPTAIPGFTYSPCSADVSVGMSNYIKGQILESEATFGNVSYPLGSSPFSWSVQESYGSCFANRGAFDNYLASTLGNGAKLLAILGWTDGPGSTFYLPKNRDHFVHAGIRTWLKGESIAPAGIFSVGQTVFYSNGDDAYCHLVSPGHLNSCGFGGKIAPVRGSIPDAMRNDGACSCGSKFSEGLFQIGGGVFYSNGNDAYCGIGTPAQLTGCGWGKRSIATKDYRPHGMRFDDPCSCGITPAPPANPIASATPVPAPGNPPAQGDKAPEGLFASGGGIYYSNGADAFCVFTSPGHLAACGMAGKKSTSRSALPGGMRNDGPCSCANKFSEGLFQIGGGVFYSNGNDAYCGIATPAQLTGCGWGKRPIATKDYRPHGMRFDDPCSCGITPAPPAQADKAPEGLFASGGGIYYSNGGDAFCVFTSQGHLTACGMAGKKSTSRNALPAGMRNDGPCSCANKFSEGLFQIGGGVFYSNGNDAYCGIATPAQLTGCGWGKRPIATKDYRPHGMRFDDPCSCGI